MSEIRRDLRGEAVLITPGRAGRPYDFRSSAGERRARCPFCSGRESLTPPEADAVRPDGSAPDTPGWRARAFPNLFPAFPREPPADGAREPSFGVHEVIIETCDHGRGLADLSAAELRPVLELFQRRILAAREDSRLRYGCLFKNRGERAGASLEHDHCQWQAGPFTPSRILGELAAARSGELARRMRDGFDSDRAALREGDVGAFAPFDARFPYELWIAPVEPQPFFEEAPAATLEAAAFAISRLGRALFELRGRDVPYHVMLYTAPFAETGRERYWWRIELFPRLVRVAGFELATGVFVNQVDPAKSAEEWRREIARPKFRLRRS